MTGVELTRQLKLSDLEVDRLFDNREIVLDIDNKSMTTFSWGETITNTGKTIRIENYDLETDDSGRVLSINNNGYDEIFPHETEYCRYSEELKAKGITA